MSDLCANWNNRGHGEKGRARKCVRMQVFWFRRVSCRGGPIRETPASKISQTTVAMRPDA
jgi:hypothetical protein